MPNCKHYDICGLPDTYTLNREPFCILHYPTVAKNGNDFSQRLEACLRANHADYRYVVFPENMGFTIRNRSFETLLNLENVTLNGLDASGTTFKGGLLLTGSQVTSINLSHATFHGPCNIELTTAVDNFSGEKACFTTLSFSAKHCQNFVLIGSDITGHASVVVNEQIKDALCQGAKLHGGISFQSYNIARLDLEKAVIGDKCDFSITTDLGTFHAPKCELQSATVAARRIGELELKEAHVNGLLSVTAMIEKIRCDDSIFQEGIQFDRCRFLHAQLSFEKVTFGSSSTLAFPSCDIDGSLSVRGPLSNPTSIILDGCRIKADTTINAEVGKPPIKLIAKEKRPDFRGSVVLENVSLAECKLIGNPIDKFEMRNIEWNHYDGRAVLFDEIVLPMNSGTIRNLKQAYQVLKERYRTLGDHVTSGDFHFGEMEMTRREYGRVRRHLGLTGFYYALSGYGTQPVKALRFLCYLLVLFACLFGLDDPAQFVSRFFHSIELTLQAASFQPLTPKQTGDLSLYVRIVFLAARILIPLQAALLALAIRMRLKR